MRDKSLPDSAILQAVEKGDVQAFERLFFYYHPLLMDYGLKLCGQTDVVEDCLQDIFLNLWKNRKQLGKIHSLHAYLLVSLRRCIVKGKARSRKMAETSALYLLENTRNAFSAEELLIYREMQAIQRRELEMAFQQLPAKVRETIYLKTYQGLSYREIATILQITPQVARNYMWEGVKRIRELLKQHTEE